MPPRDSQPSPPQRLIRLLHVNPMNPNILEEPEPYQHGVRVLRLPEAARLMNGQQNGYDDEIRVAAILATRIHDEYDDLSEGELQSDPDYRDRELIRAIRRSSRQARHDARVLRRREALNNPSVSVEFFTDNSETTISRGSTIYSEGSSTTDDDSETSSSDSSDDGEAGPEQGEEFCREFPIVAVQEDIGAKTNDEDSEDDLEHQAAVGNAQNLVGDQYDPGAEADVEDNGDDEDD